MKIIFAQGNPGGEYSSTRHNVGFFLIDHLAKEQGVTFKKSDKFTSETAETTINSEKVLLVKPLTFYNETGLAARKIIDFYKVDPSRDLLVIHDDMALPLGTVRVRHQGSDAGNNGIKSLNAHLGEDYARLRIGIWNEQRGQADATSFVLGKFTLEEKSTLDKLFPHVLAATKDFASGTLQADTKVQED